MATQADVRRIALSFPAVEEGADHFAFSVPNKGKLKGFVWVWMERVTRMAMSGAGGAREACEAITLTRIDLAGRQPRREYRPERGMGLVDC